MILALLLAIAAALAEGQRPCPFQVVAGPDPSQTGDSGPAASAYLFAPHGLGVDSAGNLYIADTRNHRIRRVGSDGTIVTVAGNGTPGSGGDGGTAVAASLSAPEAVLAAADGSFYVAATGNHRIRLVDGDGHITAVVGTGHPGFSGDRGPAVEAELRSPSGMALDSSGALFFADTDNDRIRKVDLQGTITTVAGTRNPAATLPGCCSGGDGGPATSAHLLRPKGLAVGPDGTIYIADTNNNLVRRVAPDGTITTIAGTTNSNPSLPKYPAPALSPLGSAPGNVALLPTGPCSFRVSACSG
ncbi:MAG: hypothetical protein LAP87_26065 [Acidobacteriia bacterium]|nr:hypothetical protein [Terriglobia bacterium]